MELLIQIADNLEQGEDEKVTELTRQAIAQHISPKDILEKGLITGMSKVSELFKAHEIFLPEVLLAAKAMCAGLVEIKPLLAKEGIPVIGKVVIGSVQGDLHDIGKNLVGIMLKGAGFEIIDLGNDVAPEKFIDIAIKENAHIIGMSALLTTTMPVMKKVVQLLKQQNLYGKIKVIIGGAPVTEEYAHEIGAHSYGYDGANAVDRVKQLL